MKSFFILAVICAGFCSCKKEYTCVCTTYYSVKNPRGTYNTFVFPGNQSNYTKKLTQKQAKSACNDEENSIKTDVTGIITEDGAHPLEDGASVTTSCGLK